MRKQKGSREMKIDVKINKRKGLCYKIKGSSKEIETIELKQWSLFQEKIFIE